MGVATTLLIAAALAFAFVQAFRDAPLSLAPLVSTGALRPNHAIVWAAAFQLLSVSFFGVQVATTVAFGIVDSARVDAPVIFGALAAAFAWLGFARWRAIPASASQALIGGLIGATIAQTGPDALRGPGILPFAAFIVVAPALAFLLGALLTIAVSWLFFRATPRRVDRGFRRLQLASSAVFAIGYAGNNAQKTIAMLWLLLLSAGLAGPAGAPGWTIWAGYGALCLGTLAGGLRIARNVGQRVTRLRPAGGFCAETGAAASVLVATALGVPVSATQTMSGAIVGVGSARAFSAVRWGNAGGVVRAALLTIPATALLAAIGWRLGRSML